MCIARCVCAGSARSGLLLDAVGQLGDLRVDGLAFGHQGADFPVGIDDRGVVAALIMLMKSLVKSFELTYLTFRPLLEPMTNVSKVYLEAEPSAAEVT